MALEDYYYDGTPLQVDDSSELTKFARSILGSAPVQYLAQTVDKPGRAIRGLLSGSPSELLNLLPFSDTLGITDPNNTVGGRDLLRQYGMAGPEDTWGNFFGGLATEIVLDPLNALTFGTKSSLTALGREAAKTGLEATAMGRLGAKQAGLMGVRTPWWYDMTAGKLGAPTGSTALLTGEAGQKVLEGAGTASQWARDTIDKTSIGRSITGAYDTAGAYLRSAFIPGSGIAPDARTTPIIADTLNPAAKEARAATLDPLTRVIQPISEANDILAAKGITGPEAQRLVGKTHAWLTQGVDPNLWKPAQEAEGALIRELAGVLEPSAMATRELGDTLRDLRVQAGAKIGKNENVWGLKHLSAATIENRVAKNAVKKSKVIPEDVLYGGQLQFDEIVRDSPITGIMNQPIPPGMNVEQVMKARRRAVLDWAATHEQSVLEAADKKFGPLAVEPPPAATPATAPGTPAPIISDAEKMKMSDLAKRFDEVYGPNAVRTGPETTVRIEQGPGAGTVVPPENIATAKPLTEKQMKVAKVKEKIRGMTDEEFAAYIEGKPEHQVDKAVSYRYDLEEIQRQRNTYGSDQLRNAEAGTNVNAIGNYSGGSQSILDDMIRGREAELAAKEFADAERQGLFPKSAEPTPAPAGPATPPPVTPPAPPTPATPSLVRPAGLMPDPVKKSSIDLAEIVAGVSPEVAATKAYYRFDPISQLTGAVREGSQEVGRGQATMAAIVGNVVRRGDEAFRADPGAFVRLDKALNKMGMVGKDIESLADGTQIYTQGARHSLMQHLKEQGFTSLDVTTPTSTRQIGRELKKLMIPKDLVPKLAEEFKGPSMAPATGLLGKVREYGDTLRSWMTQPWVAFHGRNVGEGLGQTQLSTGAAFKDYKDVLNYARGAIKDPELAKELAQYTTEAIATGAAHQGQVRELMGKSVVNQAEKGAMPFVPQVKAIELPSPEGSTITKYESINARSPGQVVKDFYSGYNPKVMAERGEKWATLNPKENVIVQQGMRMSSAADDAQRMAQFVALRRKGYAPQAAADLVTQTHLDYSALTPFEQQLRNVVPFYSFSRRNLARTAAQAQDPGALVSILRAGAQGGEGYMPGYITQGTAAAIPGAEEGKQRYISGLSTPFDDELMGSVLALAQGNIGEAGKRAFSTTSPLLKLAATLGTGRELYSGRRLDEYTPTGLAGLLPNYAGNVLSQFASATPAGRVLSTVNTAVGGKDQNILARMVLGVRTTDVDTEMASAMAARDAVNQALRRTGMVASTESLYPKKEYRDEPPEKLSVLLDLMQQIRQHGQEVSQTRQP